MKAVKAKINGKIKFVVLPATNITNLGSFLEEGSGNFDFLMSVSALIKFVFQALRIHNVPADKNIEVAIKDQDNVNIPIENFDTIINQFIGCSHFHVEIELSNVMTKKVDVRKLDSKWKNAIDVCYE